MNNINDFCSFFFILFIVGSTSENLFVFLLFISGLTESLFLGHKDEYPEYEQASLRQLFDLKVCLAVNDLGL